MYHVKPLKWRKSDMFSWSRNGGLWIFLFFGNISVQHKKNPFRQAVRLSNGAVHARVVIFFVQKYYFRKIQKARPFRDQLTNTYHIYKKNIKSMSLNVLLEMGGSVNFCSFHVNIKWQKRSKGNVAPFWVFFSFFFRNLKPKTCRQSLQLCLKVQNNATWIEKWPEISFA